MNRPVQRTRHGSYYIGESLNLFAGDLGRRLQGKVSLVLTSPPFPLNNKKSYGNLDGEHYKNWLASMANPLSKVLKPDGSIVIELGNAWVKGRPVQSLLHLKSLIALAESPGAKLRLCQQFVCYNPARLPSPAPWVTVKRIRVTDSFTHVWWLAKSDYPKADNRRILRPYSRSMNRLLSKRRYNTGKRPSEHTIGRVSFLKNHGGSIAHNFIELEAMLPGFEVRLPNAIRIANTNSNDFFLRTCREQHLNPHPARMPVELAAFFIEFLTDPGDLILDPFAGSNTTGFVAELLGRRWVSFDISGDYVEQSRIRFDDPVLRESRRVKE